MRPLLPNLLLALQLRWVCLEWTISSIKLKVCGGAWANTTELKLHVNKSCGGTQHTELIRQCWGLDVEYEPILSSVV